MDRPTSRRLLFDAQGLLGRVDDGKGLRTTVRTPAGPVVELGFSGVHAVAPALLDRITETGTFSILDTYLRLAGEGARILPFRVDGCTWIDIGKNADLERAELHASRAAGAKVE
jgi:NDP-sugar pyrophosphorylase family protein